jgi:hypothetical protein
VAWLSLQGPAKNQLESPHRREAVRSVDLFQFPLAHASFSIDGRQYPCPDCSDAFSDAAARIRHRKSAHGYEPYHTEEYLARQSLKGKEVVSQGPGKAVSNKTRRQRAASAAPYSVPHTPSSDAAKPKAPKVTYHNEFWKTLRKMRRYYAENPDQLKDIQVGLPLATNPGPHTPEATQPFPNASIQPVAPMQPSLPPSNLTSNDYGFFGQLDAMSPQGQPFAGPSTQGLTATYPVASDYAPLPLPTEINTTTFTSGFPPTYSGVGFVNQPQGFPSVYSYSDASSSIPDAITPPTLSTSPSESSSVDLQLSFTPITPQCYELAALLEPIPQAGPSCSPGSSQAIPAQHSQLDTSVMPGTTIDFDFDAWFQSTILGS